jgi:hypothetical protein
MNKEKFEVRLNYKSSNEEKREFIDLIKSLFQAEPTEFSNLFRIETKKFEKFVLEFQNSKLTDWELISVNEELPWTIKIIELGKNVLNWRLLQLNPETSDLFVSFSNIERYNDYLDWNIISCDTRIIWTLKAFNKFKNKLKSTRVWDEKLEKIEFLNLWYGFSGTPSLTKEIVESDLDFWDWEGLSKHKVVTEFDIFSLDIFKRIDLRNLSQNNGLKIQHLRKLKQIYDQSTFSNYSGLADKKYGSNFNYKGVTKSWYFNWKEAFSNAQIEYYEDFKNEFADILEIESLDGGAKGFFKEEQEILKIEELRFDKKFRVWLLETLQNDNISKLPNSSSSNDDIGRYYLDNHGTPSSRFCIKIYKEGNLRFGLDYPENSYPNGISWCTGDSNIKLKLINEIENYIYNTDGYCLKKESINYYYKNPVDFFKFYEEFDSLINNVDLKETPIDYNNINRTIKLQNLFNNKLDCFIKDQHFIKNLHVYKILTKGSSSTRRSDTFYDYTEYRLFYNGIAVTDDYIKSILPKESFNSEREYNDSTPSAGNKKSVKIFISGEDTLDFRENYSLKKHHEYLFDIISNKSV